MNSFTPSKELVSSVLTEIKVGIGVLTEIRDQIGEHNRIARLIGIETEKGSGLERDIRDELREGLVRIARAIEEQLAELAGEPREPKPIRFANDKQIVADEAKLRAALQIVRDILDLKDVELPYPWRGMPMVPENIRKQLFDVEELLSTELGQPTWRGRR
ncbi:MAG: hypothetical protein ACREI9_04680 [Nitrospiraceae bacterium]